MMGVMHPSLSSADTELTVVANRLPVRRTGDGWKVSPGGLVTALRPVLEKGGAWVGWSGDTSAYKPFVQDGVHVVPVELDDDDLDEHYAGFSNATLWPLYHNAVREPVFDVRWWDRHVLVNKKFAVAAAGTAGDSSMVWVHDYHLQLVPKELRDLRPDLRIGFFLHIPFPPPELFNRLPWRRELVAGLAGADVIGFQTDNDAENFRRAAVSAGFFDDGIGIVIGEHRAEVAAFPISIDVAACRDLAEEPATQERAAKIRSDLGNPDVVYLGVDRLDYTKGIDVRLQAFGKLLESGALGHRDAVFVQIAVPSRESVEDYIEARQRVEQLVGELNGTYGRIGHPVVHYAHRELPFDVLVAMYQVGDVMVVTPFSDGMNLVAKEFIVSRTNDEGVLVLSEFAGAASELDDVAVLVNPFDPEAMTMALIGAATLPKQERVARMARAKLTVLGNDVHDWSAAFLARLRK